MIQASRTRFYIGDCIAFGPTDWLGSAISLGTLPWSLRFRACHFGIVGTYNSQLCLYESTSDPGLGNCLHGTGDKIVTGVQVHPLMDRLSIHLYDRKAKAWRLPLSDDAKNGLRFTHGYWWRGDLVKEEARSLLGTGYDFFGALRARTVLGGWSRWLHPADPHAGDLLFCSEFVLVVLQKLGLLPPAPDFEPSKYHPKLAAKTLVRRGICLPPERIVI